ncbi:hypothetical protein [Herbaspirillum sp. SJZ107]|uniref:post-PEP-CTERM-1 domain-containing protein n=1 Tax=Herbaspirillum sp. SJZ107 TaxID=2572881 RepID=UPI00114DCDEB|nr:hypothetical protein [Herbaspirillum sp. SJZ107]TQK10809.1 hypothetical protein FBX97_0732 [Herbaspirillum sp. SJZ107]
MSKQRILNASALATLCALAAFSLQAKAEQQAQPASAHSQEGMVVVRDAQTGKMRAPTPDELKALRARNPAPAALAAGTPPPHQALAPRRDGTRGVRLGDRTMVYDVVTRGADGKLSSECVHGAAAAEAALGAAPATDAHEEHVHETR